MKQGWIQVENSGAKEPLAPKTMADMVYTDALQTQTVKDALPTSAIPLSIARGGTGASTAAASRTNLGLQSGATSRILAGVASLSLTANVTGSIVVTFTTAFPSGTSPVIVATPMAGIPGTRHVNVGNITRTGFTIFAISETSYAMPICWVAVL